MSSEDTKLQILAEHYNSTYDTLVVKIKERDKFFLLVLVILIVKLFRIYTPEEAILVLTQLISSRLGVTAPLNFSFIESVIWFCLLAAVLRYFQSVVYLERQYDYTHKLESQLSAHFENSAFVRESSAYLKNFPLFLNWASFLYTVFFPILLMVIIGCKVTYDFRLMGFKSLLSWFNGLVFLAIMTSTVLYLIVIHSRKQGKKAGSLKSMFCASYRIKR
ncbi:MAG: hypothetical protein P9L93_02035 [Candidatus Gorgyraea atricola]|nr:hypothetical protein [Candidatus Gorgyraea atricola]